jgi:hypothetical protein
MTSLPAAADVLGRLRILPHAARQYCVREFTQNPRLHYWTLLVAAILWIALWFQIGDAHRRERQEIDAATHQLTELRQLARETEWRDRRTTIDHLRLQLESRLWTADSEALAQANFQDALVKLAGTSGMPSFDIRVELVANPANALKLRQMSASLSGSFNAEALQHFLAAMARDEHVLVVDRLHIEISPSPRFDMLVTTYLRPTGAVPRDGNAARRT